ncbi:glycoside hydrolase family 31 protein [Halopiger djelfimassiliensis]|uniref:glycoside hydrolase family 31 protein n=1 Tax=Halopiger djelfimassiliensis TaxID=1293047 RepID=UPI000677B165|nr:glycoside hydrolase family 31 protein [Halopiger djelfimassiliensis]
MGGRLSPFATRRTVLQASAALLAGGTLASTSARADHYDSKIHYEPELDEDNLQTLSVRGYEILEDGVKVDLGEYEGYVRLFADDMARVSIVERGEEEYESRGIAKGRTEWDAPEFTVDTTDERIALETATITIEINNGLFGVRFRDDDGNVINEDYLEKGTPGYEDGKPYAYKKTDEDEAFYGFGEQPGNELNKRGEKLEHWNTDQYAYSADNDYVYTSIPFFVGLKDVGAYGILFDDPCHSVFEMATESDDYYSFFSDGGQLTYYFTYGPDIEGVLERYTELTGTMELPPKWGLGLHQSKWEYTPKEIVETAETYREKGIPLDAMHFDIDYMNEYRVFTWTDEYREALRRVESVPGIRTVAVNDPGVAAVESYDNTPDDPSKDENPYDGEFDGDASDGDRSGDDPSGDTPYDGTPDASPREDGVSVTTSDIPDDHTPYDVYIEGTKNDYWVKNADGETFVGRVWPDETVWPDFARPEVRSWWAEQHDALFEAGIDGIKNDMAEPAVFQENEKYDWTMPVDNVHGTGEDAMSHAEYHNMYGFDMARAAHEAYDVYKPDERPFLLNRNLYAGGQRYAALWTGDNVSSWAHLRKSIPMQLNLGLSGLAFVGHDIGGFVGRPSPELFARWIELGAFVPYCRNHADSHTKVDDGEPRNQHPWTFGDEVETISKTYLRLRYRLLPYLYNEFREASETGKPVQQPLVFHFQNDERARDVDDQFMFGDDLLIAPVLEEGATAREVYLPEGEQWIDYWTGEEYDGGRTLTVDAPLDHLPIFVRTDSIIPMREVQQYTDEQPLTTLVLDAYVDGEATYSFYEDDGESRAYEDGEYNVTDFSVSTTPGGVVTFEHESVARNYDGSQLSSYVLKLNRAESPRKVQAASTKYEAVDDAETVEDTPETFAYSEEEDAVFVHVPAHEDETVKLFFNGTTGGRRNHGNESK